MSYSDAFSSVYDCFTGDVSYLQRAEYIAGLLKSKGITDGTILDLACGTGSISVELCKMGYDTISVDISEDMLIKARQKLAAFGEKALILCQNMLELDLYGTVKAAVCTLDSINHLANKSEVQTVFDRVSLFTEPGGVFIFDVNTLYKHRCVLADNTFVYENEDAFLVWQNSLCEDNRTVNIMLDIFTANKNGTYKRESEDFCETAFSANEISSMLKKAGFFSICVYGDMTMLPPSKKEERMYFFAVKK